MKVIFFQLDYSWEAKHTPYMSTQFTSLASVLLKLYI